MQIACLALLVFVWIRANSKINILWKCHSDMLKKYMEEGLQIWVLGFGFSRHKFT